MSTRERWRQIPGFKDYDVSDQGRIRSWKGVKTGARSAPELMKIRLGNDGYPRVTLQNSRGQKSVQRVHILVARAFLGPARGRLVLHKSGKEHDPRLKNLEYGTHMDNHDDKYRHGTSQVGERNSQAELTQKHVKEIYKLRKKYTQKEIAEMYGVSRQAVSDIHRGITWEEVTGANR